MTRCCQDCGAHVSDDYGRVYGKNDGSVEACPNCAANADIKDGAAAGLNNGLRSFSREA